MSKTTLGFDLAGGFVNVVGGFLMESLGPIGNAISQAATRSLNGNLRNTRVPFHLLHRLWGAGLIGTPEFVKRASEWGINIPKDAGDGDPYNWGLVSAQMLPHFDLTLMRELYRRGAIGTEAVNIVAQAVGMDPAFQLPTTGEAGKSELQLFLDYSEVPKVPDLIVLANRKIITPEQFTQGLRNVGITDAQVQDWFTQLRNEIPSPSELLHWLTRNAFDADYVKDFDLLNGFEERFVPALSAEFEAWGWAKKYQKLAYAAHWQLPANGEQRELIWRNRPGVVPDNIVYTAEMFAKALREKDVAPFYIDRLLNTIYKPIPLRQLRQLYNFGTITTEQAKDALLAQGFNDATAGEIVGSLEQQKKLALAQLGHGYTVQELQTLLSDGHFTEDEYRARMQGYGFDELTINQGIDKVKTAWKHKLSLQVVAKIRKSYFDGLLSELQARNRLAPQLSNQELIDLTINAWNDEKEQVEAEEAKKHSAEIKKEKTKVIKTGFLDGRWSIVEAAAMLAQAGVAGDAIAELSDLWTLELSAKAKWPPLADLKAAAKSGSLPVNQFAALLASMNYSPEAIGLEVSEILLAEKNATQKQKDALAKQLAGQAAKLTRSKKHQAEIAFNYKSALKKADLSVELANQTDKQQKATEKAALAKLLAAGKQQVELMPPL